MWDLGMLILCEALSGAVLAFSLRVGGDTTDYGEHNAGCVAGWTVFIIICTLLGYGWVKVVTV